MIRSVKACGVDFAQWRAIVVGEWRESGVTLGTFDSRNLGFCVGDGGLKYTTTHCAYHRGYDDHRCLRDVANPVDEHPTRPLSPDRRHRLKRAAVRRLQGVPIMPSSRIRWLVSFVPPDDDTSRES